MKRIYLWLLSACVALWVAIPMLVLAQTTSPTPPESISDTIELVQEGIDASKLGGLGWVVLSIAILKAFWLAVGRIPYLRERFVKWGVEINVVMTAVIAILSMVVGGATWPEVLMVAVTGPLMGFLHDAGKLVWNLKKKNAPEEVS